MENIHWKVETVETDSWRRTHRPLSEASDQARVHVIPLSPEAIAFTWADVRPGANPNDTYIGWNSSLVWNGEHWVRAYRPTGSDPTRHIVMANRMIGFLEVAVPIYTLSGRISYIGEALLRKPLEDPREEL